MLTVLGIIGGVMVGFAAGRMRRPPAPKFTRYTIGGDFAFESPRAAAERFARGAGGTA